MCSKLVSDLKSLVDSMTVLGEFWGSFDLRLKKILVAIVAGENPQLVSHMTIDVGV